MTLVLLPWLGYICPTKPTSQADSQPASPSPPKTHICVKPNPYLCKKESIDCFLALVLFPWFGYICLAKPASQAGSQPARQPLPTTRICANNKKRVKKNLYLFLALVIFPWFGYICPASPASQAGSQPASPPSPTSEFVEKTISYQKRFGLRF